jgi:hypothetical protein
LSWCERAARSSAWDADQASRAALQPLIAQNHRFAPPQRPPQDLGYLQPAWCVDLGLTLCCSLWINVIGKLMSTCALDFSKNFAPQHPSIVVLPIALFCAVVAGGMAVTVVMGQHAQQRRLELVIHVQQRCAPSWLEQMGLAVSK